MPEAYVLAVKNDRPHARLIGACLDVSMIPAHIEMLTCCACSDNNRNSEYLECLPYVLQAENQAFSNPYRQWMVWSAEVRRENDALRKHDEIMDAKVHTMLKSPPPEYTIAGKG